MTDWEKSVEEVVADPDVDLKGLVLEMHRQDPRLVESVIHELDRVGKLEMSGTDRLKRFALRHLRATYNSEEHIDRIIEELEVLERHPWRTTCEDLWSRRAGQEGLEVSDKVVGIKACRELSGCSLLAAKIAVDHLVTELDGRRSTPWETQCKELLMSGRKVDAIRVCRRYTGWSLKAAMDHVNGLVNSEA